MGHIVETKDDEMDWKVFYEHGVPKGIPDEEWRAIVGNRAWKLLHGAVDNFPCPTCRHAGQILLSGMHDMVNLHTGKEIYDPKKVAEFLGMVHEFEKALHQHHLHEVEVKHPVGHRR